MDESWKISKYENVYWRRLITGRGLMFKRRKIGRALTELIKTGIFSIDISVFAVAVLLNSNE